VARLETRLKALENMRTAGDADVLHGLQDFNELMAAAQEVGEIDALGARLIAGALTAEEETALTGLRIRAKRDARYLRRVAEGLALFYPPDNGPSASSMRA
jgi:hypothetical protein